jgi:DNA-binding LytR/AlgR family response regulator
MLEIAICDDDPLITTYLAATLERNADLLSEPFRIQLFNQGTALLAALPFDIIFLDIELGDTTGIRAAEEIRKEYEETVLVFVSAHESYCKELFRFDTTGFLGKPFDSAQVRELLPRINKKLRVPSVTFTYRMKDTICRVPVSDILFFETKARQIELVTRQRRDLFYGKLDEVEATLKHSGFTRIHHSFLVNLDSVERFTNNSLLMSGGYILPIAQRRQKETHRRIMDYYNSNTSENGASKIDDVSKELEHA